ncbi:MULTISPECIES: alpha/beta fold hydrolase [Streptomyces]|uniref:Alpha/beta fold hydrolase n=1 Tax=Streptomyces odorifer TaxID=53450 RepID=A0A7Y6C741_9ACTN|nr:MULTISPECIES: alpha/beta hydrolase [Streptomyces]NUV34755.1 alpha/beta fold hydrolase [Streptomyces sp. KAI-27]NUV45431.1 alpha/beta fold hydrolase [Streptomyces sp. CAI-78]MBL0777969.1 alpha/beta fold hydrolase [Streptomyces albidoflavus]MBL0800468.1 alpha/beta fold hydrolase [Streptomyces albidoflavus]MBV1952968.1 alpha/beta hydrolase [Streptomyces sp. BV333]
MSKPPTFVPPACARAERLVTERGEFAVLDARPAGAVRGTALLVPGYTGSKEDFIALLEPLAEAGFRVVAVDGRGQYETPGPVDEAAYARPELAADVLAQAAAVRGPGQVHLLGHSLGGQIARAAVLRDAEPFRSLTLLSSGPAEVSEEQQQRIELLTAAMAAMDMGQVWDAIQALATPEELAEPDEDGTRAETALRARWLRHSPAQLTATGRQLRTEPDLVAELAACGLPVQVVSGERDDTWPVELMDDMARRLKADRVVIPGAEHSPNTDNPADTARALAEFWQAHV